MATKPATDPAAPPAATASSMAGEKVMAKGKFHGLRNGTVAGRRANGKEPCSARRADAENPAFLALGALVQNGGRPDAGISAKPAQTGGRDPRVGIVIGRPPGR